MKPKKLSPIASSDPHAHMTSPDARYINFIIIFFVLVIENNQTKWRQTIKTRI